MDVAGLGCLRDAFAEVGGTQAPTACDPAGFAERGQVDLCSRFLLLEDSQMRHKSIGEVFPRIGLIIDCNMTSKDAHVRRKASNNAFETDFDYNASKGGGSYEVARLNVFDTEWRSAMLSAVVPLAAQCLLEHKDVIFHDKLGSTLCVLAAAAVHKSFSGGDMHVSDSKYGFETMGLTCSDPLLLCISPKRS